jgi:hypothetical protein
MSNRSEPQSASLWILAAVVLLPILYFGSYIAIGQRWTHKANPRRQIINFPNRWAAAFFRPAAYVNSAVFQRQVISDHGIEK